MSANISAIVPAAGCGARAGLGANKVLADLNGRPLLWWTLQHLQPNELFCELLIAARRDEFSIISNIEPSAILIEGGASRQQSVWNAARAASGDFVLIHDAARPLISSELIQKVCNAAIQTGAAIAALPASDTVKVASRAGLFPTIDKTLDRQTIWLAQTPQVFRREVLLQALQKASDDNFIGTDCASLVERLGISVALIEGEAQNFKVTFAGDLARAESLLADWNLHGKRRTSDVTKFRDSKF